jgi:hypothetical protein
MFVEDYHVARVNAAPVERLDALLFAYVLVLFRLCTL